MARIKFFDTSENRWVYADAPCVDIEASVVDIDGLGEITNPSDDDSFLAYNSTSDVNGKISWSTIKAKLKAYFDTLYAFRTHTHTKSQITDFPDVPTTEEFEALEEDVQDNTTAINTVSARVSVTETDIDTLSNGLEEANDAIDALDNRVDDVEASVANAGGGLGRNFIDNGAFLVNQRGQNVYTGQVYGFDRWKGLQVSSSISKPTGQGYAVISGTSGAATLQQRMEEVDVINLRGQTVTLALLADTHVTIRVIEYSSSTYGTQTRIISTVIGGGNSVKVNTFTFNPTSNYVAFEIMTSGSASYNLTWCGLFAGSKSANAVSDWEPEYTMEWLRCCRFYYKTVLAEVAINVGSVGSTTSVNCAGTFQAPVPMRTRPTASADVSESQIWSSNYYPISYGSVSASARGYNSKSNSIPILVSGTSQTEGASGVGVASLHDFVLDADL